MDKRGITTVTTAMFLATLMGAAGLAVDTTRIWLVETRLRIAVDAAALAAVRRLNDAGRDAEAAAVFWSHFTRADGTRDYLGATIGAPSIAPVPGQASVLRVQASATIPMTLFSVVHGSSITRTESATAARGGTGLELAIVMDQSSSMRESAGSGQGTKLDAARAAVHTMLDVLYAGRDSQQNLWVSVVPFSRTINIGPQNTHMLDTANMPAGWSLSAWSGCVEARRNGHDTTDAAPTGAARFRPYFWPSTFRQVGTVASGRCIAANAYSGSSNSTRFCKGDNDWASGGNAPTQAMLNSNHMYDFLRDDGMTHEQSVGPNILCAMTPMQPLTASRTAVNAALAAIQAPPKSGGTTTAVGLQGAWYTLSPNWRGMWQNPNAGIPNTPKLPLPYNTPNMRKVVVMLTDGDNNWQPAYGPACGSSDASVCSSATGTELLYNAYGRVADYNSRFTSARINPVNQTNADARLDERFTAVCDAMKANNSGITIYVIGFQVATQHRSRLQSCATSAQHYFESPSASQLQAVFQQVGAQLASVRLTN
ncbi:pilus assembly protein TadG-related protein [Falsiroseomonas oryzae]|uniref:pilus assembly protein TadG-related protein n=1 Tax=Falsiroseomonas oryzae TaxID=2766473 RepID=UPI0022EB7185|nr:VWA domain-containing protein [Roseomonas sp. MO-31]